MAVIAVAGDDAVLAADQRRLQADRHCLLPDIEMAEAADQAHAVQLAGLFLKSADQHHLPVEFEKFVGFCRPAFGLFWPRTTWCCRRRGAGSFGQGRAFLARKQTQHLYGAGPYRFN